MKHSSIESAKKSLLSLSSVLSDASRSVSLPYSPMRLSVSLPHAQKKKKKKKKMCLGFVKMVFFPL